MYYGPQIIIDSGASISAIEEQEKFGVILMIPLAFTLFVFSVFALFLIDKCGRRWIMLRTLPGLALSLISVSVCMYFSIFVDDM